MTHLGVNVYHWGEDEQTRFLAERVAPLGRGLLDDRSAAGFWFTSFDARGPHLMLLFSPGEASVGQLRERVEPALEAALAEAPSGIRLDDAVLDERHRQCRGKELCAADALPGIAANDSLHVYEHPADGYPFGHAGALAEPGDLWRRVGELGLWAIERRAAGESMAAGVRWTAAVDAALDAAGEDAESYWRHHATTLVMPLAERLANDEAAVLASLPGAVGERNLASFDRLWSAHAEAGWPGPDAASLVSLAGSASGPRRWVLLREINHTTLGQLGLQVRLHLPLVLYAWQRHHSLSPVA